MASLQKANRLASAHQVQPVIHLFASSDDAELLKDVHSQVSEKFSTALAAENFKSTQNAPIVLALSAYFALAAKKLNDKSILNVIVNDAGAASYLMSSAGYANQLDYISSKEEPSLYDVQNHMHVVEGLLSLHFGGQALKTQHVNSLMNTLCEYLLNLNCKYREHSVLSCFENLNAVNGGLHELLTVPLFETMFEKICEVSARPKKVSKEDEPAIAPQPRMTGKKVQNLIKVLYRAKTIKGDMRKSSLTKQEFMLLLRTICHPQISQRSQDLALIMETLTDLFFKQAELN